MTITVDIVGVGPVEFPDGMSKQEMEIALKKLPAPNRVSPSTVVPSDKSNYVTGDVPSVVGQYVRPQVNAPEPKTSMLDKVQALGEVPATIATSAIAQPVGAAYGVLSNVFSPEFGTQRGMQQGESAGGRLANALTYKPRSQTGQNIIETVGEMADAAKIPPYLGNIGVIPSAMQSAKVYKPFLQEATSNAIQSVQPAVNKMADALRTTDFAPKGIMSIAPTAENLASEATRLYAETKKSGTAFKPSLFGAEMNQIGSNLRELGYHPKLHPDIKVALQELQNTKRPKDMLELQSLREFINNAQGSKNPKEKMLATVLKDKFDDYVMNAGPEAILSKTSEGAKTWQQARETYSKLRKSETFTNMLERAELDKNGIGVEKSLTNQLRSFAKDTKKMRLFTAEEQEAIKQAAKGGNVQNLLSQFGRFAPTSAVSSIPSILATAASAPIGLAATAGAIGSKIASTRMKKSEMDKLAALMRMGGKSAKKVKGKENEQKR
jgi:hypothetical protein